MTLTSLKTNSIPPLLPSPPPPHPTPGHRGGIPSPHADLFTTLPYKELYCACVYSLTGPPYVGSGQRSPPHTDTSYLIWSCSLTLAFCHTKLGGGGVIVLLYTYKASSLPQSQPSLLGATLYSRQFSTHSLPLK